MVSLSAHTVSVNRVKAPSLELRIDSQFILVKPDRNALWATWEVQLDNKPSRVEQISQVSYHMLWGRITTSLSHRDRKIDDEASLGVCVCVCLWGSNAETTWKALHQHSKNTSHSSFTQKKVKRLLLATFQEELFHSYGSSARHPNIFAGHFLQTFHHVHWVRKIDESSLDNRCLL